MPSDPPARHLSRRDLSSYLHANFPEAHLAWADEIDDVFRAAGRAFMDARQPRMRAGQKQRLLIAAMTTHSPLLRRYAAKKLIDVAELAGKCKLVFQGSIDICRRSQRRRGDYMAATTEYRAVGNPKNAVPPAIEGVTEQPDDNDDTIGECIVVKHGKPEPPLVVKREPTEESEQRPPKTSSKIITLKIPPSQPLESSPEDQSTSPILRPVPLHNSLPVGKRRPRKRHLHFHSDR